MRTQTPLRITISVLILLSPALRIEAQSPSLESLGHAQTYTTHRESSAHPDLSRNGDARPIPPGETLVLGELEGPGAITHIWCTVGMADVFYPRALVVRMYWDDAEEPSVEVPLGDFFGVGHGAFANFTSLPVATSSQGRSRNCFWYMPFRKNARITVTNDSDTKCDSFYYYLDWRQLPDAPDDLTYFHARYRQESPAQPGDYTILETRGTGHYVGTVYSAHQTELGWFGEGDDRFYIDGEETPSLSGTGTEDYFNDSWGFRPFSQPFHGVSLWEGYFPGDRVTAYRWHLDSPVAFSSSLKVAIEHRGSIFTDNATHLGQFFERPDWVSSVAFWYQDAPVGPSEPLAPLAERVPPYRQLDWDDIEVEAKPKGLLTVNDDGVTYAPRTDDATLSLTFNLDEPGRYQINAVMFYSLMSGVYQPYLDDEPIGGPIDFVRTGQDPIWTRFDLHDLEKGAHELKFVGRGRSPNMRSMAPPMYGLGIYKLVLLRLEDMAGYRETMHKVLEERKRNR